VNKAEILQLMIDHSCSLFERNYTYSTGGNISHRHESGMLITATNTSFGRLHPEDFVYCNLQGEPVGGNKKPSKEAIFHAAIYRKRPEANAIVHLHSPNAIALSCLAVTTDTGNVLPVVTSGSVTRVGRLPHIAYLPPGGVELARRIEELCGGVNAILLQNHGIITYAPTMDQAVDIAEEAEQNIKVWLLTYGDARVLTDEELAQTKPLFGAKVEPGTQRPVLRAGTRWPGAQA
jgi:3-dehydro-4-phosphotetronate decarboxylase